MKAKRKNFQFGGEADDGAVDDPVTAAIKKAARGCALISGPLSERIGLLALLNPHERVVSLLHMLGGEQRVDLARNAIEAAE